MACEALTRPRHSNIGVPFSVARISPGLFKVLDALISKNFVSTTCLAPDHSGLEANVLRFDPLQAARRCSTFPTDE